MRFRPPFGRRAAPSRRVAEAETVVEGGPPGEVVEEEVLEPPPPPPRGPLVWPWLLVLLLLVVGGLVTLWLLTHDDDKKSGNSVVVPNVIGQSQSTAVERRQSPGAHRASGNQAQRLPGGQGLCRGAGRGHSGRPQVGVTLSVSAANVVVVPNVVGKTAAAATAELRAQGLAVQDL